jgi:hypothetical protein
VTHDQLQKLLTAANPLTAERARGLPVADAQDELVKAVMAERQFARPAGAVPRVRRRRVFTRVALAGAAAAIVLVALLSLWDDSGNQGSGTAWAAEQVRFAEASPLLLLGGTEWRVEYADEQSEEMGEMRFRRGPATGASSAELHWGRGGGIDRWLEDRAASAARTTTAPVLGTTAHVYQYEGGTPGHRDITALFRYDGRVLEFRAGAADLDAFKALLATLKPVDTDTWLSAMPASVIKTRDRGSTIKEMLRGIPLPPGFDPEDIKGGGLTKDRYQLGATVTGTVACQWFKRWSDARKAGDRVKEREATAAMATAKDWPILEEMAKEGAYPDVMFAFAAAMPSGEWDGRPLIGDVNPALGCEELGVDLP